MAWGFAIAAALNVPVVVVLILREGGLDAFLGMVAQSFHAFASNPDTHPIHAVWRVDLAATLSRLLNFPLGTSASLLASAVVLAPVVVMSRRWVDAPRSDQNRALDGLVYCAVLLSLFHQAYDLLLLALPAAGLVGALCVSRSPGMTPVAQAALLAVLGLNYLATQSAVAALRPIPGLELGIASANGLALLALYGLYLLEAGRIGARFKAAP